METLSGVTAEEVKRLFDYDPDTGVFTRKAFPSKYTHGPIGVPVGWYIKGYLNVCIRRKNYRLCRLAWLYVYGTWPSNQIDHINGVRDDDRIANLRDATNQQNTRNSARQRDNTSGTTGVYWHKRGLVWVASIRVSGKLIHLGTFKDYEDAVSARKTAEERYFGEFAWGATTPRRSAPSPCPSVV
jgi:hypothetical protein